MRLSGFIQADGQLYDAASENEVEPTTGAPYNQTRFFVRRARLHLDLERGHLAGSVAWDGNTVNGPATGLIDAEVTLRARAQDPATLGWNEAWAELSLGLLRTPWGLEVSERDQERFFLERSTASRALFPGVFDAGLRVRAGWRSVRLALALINGAPLGEKGYPAQDPTRAKDLVGRLGFVGTRGPFAYAAGISGVSGRGFHRGTPATKDVLVWRDQNEDGLVQQSEIQVIAGSPATPSQSFARFALGADASLVGTWPRAGTVQLYGELLWATNLDRAYAPADPVATGRDLRELGVVVGAFHELWQHLGYGVRYDSYDPDADAPLARPFAVVPVDTTVRTWTATLAWRFSGLDRVVLEAQHETNALGRSPAGAPTTLGGERLALRGQFAW